VNDDITVGAGGTADGGGVVEQLLTTIQQSIAIHLINLIPDHPQIHFGIFRAFERDGFFSKAFCGVLMFLQERTVGHARHFLDLLSEQARILLGCLRLPQRKPGVFTPCTS
jgi:hypothetical protein|tara:strand:- start:245 stop:577 length:333 start_codon:yes stop_codon:yes gene_type:complete